MDKEAVLHWIALWFKKSTDQRKPSGCATTRHLSLQDKQFSEIQISLICTHFSHNASRVTGCTKAERVVNTEPQDPFARMQRIFRVE